FRAADAKAARAQRVEVRAAREKRDVGARFDETAAEVAADAAGADDRNSHAPEYYVQFDRKDWIVRSQPRRDTRPMNTMPAETGPAEAGHVREQQLNDVARWNAVVEHNRTADGRFVYAVGTTGVYCRPSCASRRPRRENVSFFETPAAARDAGFRACKRCRPDEAAGAADPWIEKVRRACVYLANVEGHPALATLAARLGGSPYHLQRNFKRLVGVTPREYADACRLRKVKRQLRRGGDVTPAMFDAGHGSSGRLYQRRAPEPRTPPTVERPGRRG